MSEADDTRAGTPPADPPAVADAPAGGAPAAAPQPGPTGSWIPVLLLAGVGLLASFDLLVRTLALMREHTPGGIDVCNALFKVGCDDTLMSGQSWRFGIPAAGWGVVYFGAFLWLGILARAMGGWFERRAAATALFACVPGVFVSIMLTTAIVTGRAPLCPMCLVVHAVNLGLAFAVWRAGAFQRGGLGAMLGGAVRWVAGPPGSEPPEARWTVVGVGSAVLVGLTLFQWTSAQIERAGGAENVFHPAEVVREWEAEPHVDLPTSADDARRGPPDAPAHLVVFSDFECPGCSDLAPELDELAEAHAGELSIVFKHYPLSTECNPASHTNMHPGSCRISAAAEAARMQGKFWVFHDLAFDNLEGAADTVLAGMAREAGLDLARFERDRRDSAVIRRVRADIDLGNTIGLVGTPTVFLNGREVPELSRQAIEYLVEREIEKAGRQAPGRPAGR